MKVLKRILIILISIILIMGGIFFIYLNIGQYSPSDDAINIANQDAIIHKKYYEFNNNSENGFIFYPGAKVDPIAYSYLSNIDNANVYILRPYYNIAFFGTNMASKVIEEHPDETNWFIGGHSLGGVVASNYAQNNQDIIKGVALLGSYPQNKLINNSIPYISFYGTNDLVVGDYTSKKELFDANSSLIEIDGGNHSQFGDYGFQKGDGTSTTSYKQQHEIIVNNIENMINSIKA